MLELKIINYIFLVLVLVLHAATVAIVRTAAWLAACGTHSSGVLSAMR